MSNKQWKWNLQPLSPFINHNDKSTEENKDNKDTSSSLQLLKPLSLPGNFGREELLRPLSKLCPVCSLHNHNHRGKSKSPRKIKVAVKRQAKPTLCNVCQSIQTLAKFTPRQNFLSFINNDITPNLRDDQEQQQSSSSRLILQLSGQHLSRLVRITSSSNGGDTDRDRIVPHQTSSEPRYKIFDGDIISLLCSTNAGDGGGTNAQQSQFYNMVPLIQFRVIKASTGGITNGNLSNRDDAVNEDNVLQESRSVSVSILMDKGRVQHNIMQQSNEAAQDDLEQKSTASKCDAKSTGMKTVAAKSHVQENSIVEDATEISHPTSMENDREEEDEAIAARDYNCNEKVHTKQTVNLSGDKKCHHAEDASSSSSSEDEHLWTAGGFLKTRSAEENKTSVVRGNYFRDVKAKYDISKNQQQPKQHSNNHIKSNTENFTMSYKQNEAPSCMERNNNDGNSKCEETETEESESAPLTLPSQFLASYSKSFDSTEKQQSPSTHGTPQKSNQSLSKRAHDKITNSPGQANDDNAATKTPKKSNVSINNTNSIPATKKARSVPISSLSYNQLQKLHKDSTPSAAATVSAVDHQSPAPSAFRHTVLSLTLALTSNASSYDSNFLRRCKKQRTLDEDGDQHADGDSSRNDKEKQHNQQQWMPRLLQGAKLKFFDKDGMDTENA